ncbi:SIR2 family protein [Daejeonella sp. H1SJ63]|uniref:SIR2 family protein n=1 Tax=Daejeonella sp. H1SJ63 TaxID=3034145 RepID=UPI0023EC5CD7|nr:SIR2 family protein [Daejeonella sp. H1SJ63]
MVSKLTNQLIEHFNKGAFGLFIGAGLSQASGLPSWKDLLLSLTSKSKDIGAINDEREKELLTLIDNPDKYLLVAEELRETLAGGFEKYIKEIFDKKYIPSEALLMAMDLNPRFIVTTNYDQLIEQAYITKYSDVPPKFTYKNAATINYKMTNSEFFILKAHGSADDAPSEIILTEKDYRKVLYSEMGYQSVLQAMFSMNNILFLGASLKDPELLLVLRFIHHIFHGGTPDHYAFINQDEISTTEKQRWRKDFNINIITYDPKDNHAELTKIIAELVASKK